MKGHPERAAEFAKDATRVETTDRNMWTARSSRDRARAAVPDWEELRTAASTIKAHTMSRLDHYLTQFADSATANGIHVHWAKDAEEHNQIVLKLLREAEVTEVVKSKSMLTEECELNPFLERNGIPVIDTDLGERVVQLREEAPSHIVTPAIHLNRGQIAQTLAEHLHSDPDNDDPHYLTSVVSKDLRGRIHRSKVALTGVNYAVAELGGIVICTNEGNVDLAVATSDIHIASMGIEKIIPRLADLPVFLRLLARSATGMPSTIYTSHFTGPRQDSTMHVIIVDNGRSQLLAAEDHREALHCIRCGACANTCHVTRRGGGHAYDFSTSGPIGSIVAPARDHDRYGSLPFACTLCGSCSDVCPVRIPLHRLHLSWRRRLLSQGHVSADKRRLLAQMNMVLRTPQRYRLAGKALRTALRIAPGLLARLSPWGKQRDLPPAPPESFRDWYRKHRK